MKKVIERIAEISRKANIEITRLEEQVKIAEDLGLKGVAWAYRMRYRFKMIKSLQWKINFLRTMVVIFMRSFFYRWIFLI